MTDRIVFVIEQALGHVTHGENLRAVVGRDSGIAAQWVLPTYKVIGFQDKIPLYRSNWTVRAGWQVRRELGRLNKNFSPQAIFFHTQVTAMLASDWVQRLPSIISLDATPRQMDRLGDYYAHADGPAWLESLKMQQARRVFGAARRLVTWSQWAKDGLVAEYGISEEKVEVIPPGVDTEVWTRQGRQERGNGPVKILFVGGNLARKGGLLLLEAFRALRVSEGAGLELHMVTKDPVEPQPGVSVYRDMQPNSLALRKLFHQSDIFCLPTYADCLPMVLSEAGASGMPVVSTRVAAIPEVVRQGETGLLVPPGDAGLLAEVLLSLVRDPTLRLRLGSQAEEHIREMYDSRRNGERLVRMLKSVAKMGDRNE